MWPKANRPRFPAAVATALLLAATAAPAAADWLVLTNGGRIETSGPWEVRGRLVVFTDTGGRLSSLRLGDVDLGASGAATAAATAAAAEVAPAPAEPEPRQATFVLTDTDVRRAPTLSTDDVPATTRTEVPPDERLVVIEWRENEPPGEEGLSLSGMLRNRSDDAATRVRLTAMLYTSDGSLLATAEARLATNTLMPGRQTRFTADFPGIFDMSAVKFATSSLALEAGAPDGEETVTEPSTDEPPA